MSSVWLSESHSCARPHHEESCQLVEYLFVPVSVNLMLLLELCSMLYELVFLSLTRNLALQWQDFERQAQIDVQIVEKFRRVKLILTALEGL